MLHLVVMAGGSGTRFWPESRRARPKQFLTLTGDQSLLQQAAGRCRPWIPSERMHVVTNAGHAAETKRQLPDLPAANILLEPCGRNTAPCIGLAALHVAALDADGMILVAPADHLIRPDAAFRATVETGTALLAKSPDASVLIGVPPTYPATGYGYIERGDTAGALGKDVSRVHSFREKPTREVAVQFLEAGRYLWNAGIFLWRAAHFLRLLEEYQPEIHRRLMRLKEAINSPRRDEVLAAEFPGMPSISIDYGVLEPVAAKQDAASPVYVVPATFQWDDVGSWQALPAVLGTDAHENTITGPQCGIDTAGCVIRTTPDHLVATIGLSNLVVVHTPDATLIAPRDDDNAIRRLVALLEERGYGRFL